MSLSRTQRPSSRGKAGVAFSRLVVCLALAAQYLLAQDVQAPAQSQTTAAAVGTIHGIVKSGNMPIPGATVLISPASSTDKISTWTDVDGSFVASVPAGSYSVQVQMMAFANGAQQVKVDAEHQNVQANFELTLLSRTHDTAAPPRRPGAPAPGQRGFQSLSVTQTANSQDAGSMTEVVPSGMPVPGIDPNSATESIAVSGNTSNSLNSLSGDELEQRINEARQMGGGFGGGGGGFGGGGFGGGGGGRPMTITGRRGFDINRPHGSIYYTVGDAALNAAPYALLGEPVSKPGYLQNGFGASIGGPLNIPKIYHGGTKTFFFLNYNGKRGENPFDQFSTVPTLLERQGNFSQTTYTSGAQAGQPVQIFNPFTNTQFAGNTVPAISAAAANLLPYIPEPNLPGDFQNFHFVTTANSNSDDLNLRLNHTFGAAPARGGRRGGGGRGAPRNNLSMGFHYHGSSANLTNPFPSVGGNTDVRSFDVPIGYVRSIGKLTNTVRFDFNRSRTRTQNLYAFNTDIATAVGINGVSPNPFDWGLPNVSFTDFAGLQDINPALLRNQTYTFSDNAIWNHGKHTLRWGGDFRRIQINTETSNNARGSFVFTGLNTSQTSGGQPVAGTGYDFADFLLGLPQQTSVAFGADNYHFRGNSWDLFAQDEWKLRGNFTLNAGLRYEYVSPLSEENDRIADLDLSPGVLNPTMGAPSVALVLPGQTGPYSGHFPASLVRPDRNNFAPRVGFAWKPFSKTVVRGGYGINYNTGAYQGIVQQLAFQPPFAMTETNIQASAGDLTLANGFPAASGGGTTNNYAVNPNYRLGYVQIRNLDIQQQIRPTLLLNIDYTGTKGTNLDILEAPNRTATGIRIAGVQAFNFETAGADSEANAASVRLRKRMSKGFSIGGMYTYSKSIDDASTIGSGGSSAASVVAQDAFNLAAERGLSSFNQTHKLTVDYLWELPFGHDKHWLSGNTPLRAIFGDWQWNGDFTIASGLPFTPRLLGNFADVDRGTNGTLRPDLVPGQAIAISDPSLGEWFNTAAFVAPPAGQFGDARRNSIIGPGSVIFDMTISRTIPLKESRVLEFRAQASNIFNHANFATIDTVVNSPTFGRVTAVGGMRAITMTARFRF